MQRPNVIHVLIADDHPVVREGLAALINRQPGMKVVSEAGSGLEAAELFVRLKPDVTILDLRMPGSDCVATISSIRDRSPSAKIVVMSAYETEEEIYQSLLAGAEAYLLKDSPREQLVDCIRKVCSGRKWIPFRIASKLAHRMTSSILSDRELGVLKLLASGKGNKEIAQQLNITEATVKVHANHLFAKLGVSGRTEAIVQAVKRGLVEIR